MLCDSCGVSEAVIHLTQIENNEMDTFHLCETCAAEKGLDSGGESGPAAPLTDFLAQMGTSIQTTNASASTSGCSACGLTLDDLRRTGRIGCSTCYSHFDQHLRALLRRLHGGTQHVGKVFLPPDPTEADRAARVSSLRHSLQKAIDREDFERAAAIRDQIRQLDPNAAGGAR